MDTMAIITSNEAQQNPAYMYLVSLPSEASRSTMKNALNIIARKILNIEDAGRRKKHDGENDLFLVNWHELRYQQTSLLQSWLMKKYKPASARRMIAAIKGVMKAAWRMGLVNGEDYLRAVDLGRIPGENISGRMLATDELIKLLETCRKGAPKRAARDAAIITLMAGCGLRRTEVSTLALSDLDMDTGKLVVMGKGRKQRTAYLMNGTREAMMEWLTIRGGDPGPLFYAIVKSDEMMMRPVSSIGIFVMLHDREEKAGLAHFCAHDLRRTCISNWIDITDLSTAMRLAGHQNPATTTVYDKRGEARKIEASQKMHIPYTKPEEW